MLGPLAPLLPTPHCGRGASPSHRNRQTSIMYIIQRVRGDARLMVVRGRAIEFARPRLVAWGLGIRRLSISAANQAAELHTISSTTQIRRKAETRI
jgi:hypothetical protein